MGTLVINFNFLLSNCEVNTPTVDKYLIDWPKTL